MRNPGVTESKDPEDLRPRLLKDLIVKKGIESIYLSNINKAIS